MIKTVTVGAVYPEKDRAFIERYSRDEDVFDTLSVYGMTIIVIQSATKDSKPIASNSSMKLDYMIFPGNSALDGIVDMKNPIKPDSKLYEAFNDAVNSSNPMLVFKVQYDTTKSKQLAFLK